MKKNFHKLLNLASNGSIKPIIVAEMSGNHNQSIDRAIEIVDAAAESGADAIKLQTYTADTMTIPGALTVDDPKSIWFGRELHDLYKEAYTPWDWHQAIFERAKEKNIFAFSSPFDESAVDFLESLDVPCYKISSLENNHIPLLKKVALTGKPVIMSTGVSSISVIEEAVETLKSNGCKDIILLKCTSTYPATPENTNLKTIPHLKNLFDVPVGLSDHTMGIGVPIAAVAMGACLIEKHFTLNRKDGGVDSSFSIEPHELKSLCIESERAFNALGKIKYGVLEAENKSLDYKRSIYVVKDISPGEKFSKNNLNIIRPGYGMEPKYYQKIIGKTSKISLKAGTPFKFDLFL